jgi:glycosyltransferase involved in cell wall biosynthesis
MKIVKVIHGYPPNYNAGSEVYSQTLCNGLSEKHEVYVVTREENPFVPDYSINVHQAVDNPKVKIYAINIPLVKYRYAYSHPEIDKIFDALLTEINPDVVHFGHLNHLSASMVEVAYSKNLPIVYTLHDYWLMCPRGQFMQRNPDDLQNNWKACDQQVDGVCAKNCYGGYFSGVIEDYPQDLENWTGWVHRRMAYMQKIVSLIDVFLCPANYLLERFKSFIPEHKLVYLDYGFNLETLKNRERIPEEDFVFGYIGTHTPQKGIDQLIKAFGNLDSKSKLRIWGRPRPEFTPALKDIVKTLPPEKQEKIEWISEYSNPIIVTEVFNKLDAIVVPSIWVENSPLVIHEAQQVGVPVITADVGGMKEYVGHEVNGLLFKFRDMDSLRDQMQRFADDPTFAAKLGARRYLYSENGNVPNVKDHIQAIEEIYRKILNQESDQNETRPMAYNL